MVSLLLGRALLASGEAGEATARLGPAADRPEASPYLLTLVGQAYEHLGQREKAAQYLDRAAGAPHLGPGVLAARDDPESGAGGEVHRVRKLLAHGGATQARAVTAQLVAHYPGSIDVELLAGDAALLAGDAPSALRYYQRVVEVRRDLALVERMAAAHRLAAQPRAAMAVAADYAAQNPRSGPAAAFLGRMLAEQGDWAKARVLLDYAARVDRGRGDPLLLADLSVAQLTLDQGQNATDNARRAYGLQRANSGVTAILARTLQTANAPRAESEVLLAKARDRAAPGALAGR
jgi:predicted Zn-dependent protease